ncbi:amidohydrolase family protein [Streptomyces broussonetiae]|uniref:Amidohydrolase family protein n=1 Tax=Streptomyces broussonetiae TaxID=2686304 RepID=A0A6I6NE28_9ACTN|nr:amidohydrolase [Streptomyces broussonetiae]QHA08641.1 amidohydrolase family protein [Streptomyces broussonetiae]
MTDHGADLLVRAAAVHTLVPGQAPQRALAVRGERIAALSPDPNGLDHWVSPRTRVLDLPGATVLPAFDDTHTHLIFAALGAHDVPVHQARSIPEFLDLIRQRAQLTPEGEWIRTTTNWQELNLAERRMPTAAELDQATDRHPVLVKRGGHNDVVNTYALRLAGITEDTPVPPGGVIGRDADGRLDGRLIDNALPLVERLVPAPERARRIDGLRLASRDYAASGIGTVRDCAVTPEDHRVLLAAREAGALHTRVRALISALGLTSAKQVEDLLDVMEEQWGTNDPWLRVWGVKFGLDGGLEAGATEEPYACDHAFSGTLMWEPDALAEAVEAVVRRGRRVGTHAYGDRAVRTLLDVYERVLERNPGLPAGTLVMEHGGLAGPEQRTRAVALGVPVTIQQPLLHDTAEVEEGFWGPERVARLFPARGWIDLGAEVSAGSDFPVGQFGAMRSVWGMTTRQTVIGVKGPEHAITYDEALALHTTRAVRLLGEEHLRGTLTPGRLADLTVWDRDPAHCTGDALRDLTPTHTFVGGRGVAPADE